MTLETLLRMPVPLTHEAHADAAQFAAEQTTIAKGKRVYLNTLAVYALHTYLDWLEISTNLTQSDCWQPGLRAVFDVADLTVPAAGTLECCPVLPGETAFTVPDSATDRIGYVAVQFQADLNTVELLGFVRAVDERDERDQPLEIQLDDLLSLDSLPDLLHPETAINDLRQWLEGQFDDKWRPVDQILLANRSRSSTRDSISLTGGFAVPSDADAQVSSVSRAMKVELGQPDRTVVLVVQVIAITSAENRLNVSLRLYPGDQSTALPRNLVIAVLDETGAVYLESRPNQKPNSLPEFSLDCQSGERFSLRISLGRFSLIEEFCI